MQPAIAVKQVTLDSLDKDVELGFVPAYVTISAESSITSATVFANAVPDGKGFKVDDAGGVTLISSSSSGVVPKSDTFYGITIKSGIGFATGSSATVQVVGYRDNQ